MALHSTSGSAPTPLVPVLVASFLSSIGTGVVTNGVFFISAQGYAFSKTDNYWLALVLGITYIAGASQAGRIMGALSRLGISTRALLGAQLAAMAALAALPWAAGLVLGGRPVWALWVLVIVYSPISGILWPTIESYISGGRDGPSMRLALGHFNWVWSSATVLALLFMGPLVEDRPVEMLAALAALHILTIPLLAWFTKEPGAHGDGHTPDPRSVELLRVFRVLLPVSYAVATAMGPYLPTALESLGVDGRWRAPLAGVWHAARVFVFVALGLWHGWHGRWWPAWIATLLLIAGFSLVVLSGGSEALGLGIFISGLFAFGVGMATIYTSALYYAQEVGSAKVGAGGAHEAFIGIGYSVGPTFGLVASGAVRAGILSERRFESSVVLMVGVVAAAIVLPVFLKRRFSRRRTRARASQ